jgi:hypothetical protein
MLAQCVHCLGELRAFFFNFPGRLDDLLVKDLVAVSEVSHTGAENHGVLVHVYAHLTFFSHQLNDGLAILGLFKNLVRLCKLFEVFNLEEVD